MEYRVVERKIQALLQNRRSVVDLQQIVEALYEGFEKYSWVGIYIVRGDELILGPWKGTQATEHTRIPLGRGVCGAAATSGRTEVVDDVSKDERYLSCFLSTRSEIVVPIKRGQRILGEIDIDSDTPAAFDAADVRFLEKVADMLSRHI
jgi:putative methionine-R-sulfoxide reductase with GAF domain